MRRFILAALAAATAATPALADSSVRLDQSVFVERSGNNTRIIEPARRLLRGDRVVLVLDWQAPPAPRGFTVTSTVPAALSFQRSSAGMQDVSVDGGRSWGRIGSLRVHDGDGFRLATPEDVTHLRWRIRGQRTGRLTYSAIVR